MYGWTFDEDVRSSQLKCVVGARFGLGDKLHSQLHPFTNCENSVHSNAKHRIGRMGSSSYSPGCTFAHLTKSDLDSLLSEELLWSLL